MTTSAKSTTIKLLTNVPLIGVLNYVDFSKSKTEGWSDQIALKGHFDGHGEGRVYLSDWLAKPMIENGIIEAAGTDRDGNQAYKVLYKGRVQILREENGPKKYTTILPLDQAATPAAGAVSPPPAASPRTAAPAATGTGGGSPQAVPASGPASTKEDGEWASLHRNYRRAIAVAIRAWGENQLPLEGEVLVAAAATVFIEANKRGLTVPAPVEKLSPEQKAEAVRDAFDRYSEKPKALAEDDDSALPF
jgi:hypothetical protein